MSWVRESAPVSVTSWSRTTTAWVWRRISTGTVACAVPRVLSRGKRLPVCGAAASAATRSVSVSAWWAASMPSRTIWPWLVFSLAALAVRAPCRAGSSRNAIRRTPPPGTVPARVFPAQPADEVSEEGAVMTTLDIVAKKKPEPSAEETAAKELVRQAREQGLSLTGPEGLLKQFPKSVLETALNEEMSGHLGHEKHRAPEDRESTNIRNGTGRRGC